MPETINMKEVGHEVLGTLEKMNKNIWHAVSFRMVHALMSEEKQLKDSYQKIQESRKERWQKALLQSKGNKRKAYDLVSSADFY